MRPKEATFNSKSLNMKKIITLSITAILCLVISANAQINKGSIMIGGTLNGYFNNVKNPDTVSSKTNNFSIQPAIGFAVDTNTNCRFFSVIWIPQRKVLFNRTKNQVIWRRCFL